MSGSERRILHVDMDAFFAAVEVLDEPSLAGLPVVVGGSPQGRGVVCSATYEARAFGVRSAMPCAQASRLCPQAVFLPPRMSRYAEISRELFGIFHEFSPLVQGISVDEAFLDVTGCERLLGPAPEIARAIQDRVKAQLGLTCSVGVAPNKFLAKLASDMEKPEGLVVLEAETAAARIAGLPVEALMGVGKVAARKLRSLGMRRVRHVQQASPALLEAAVGRFASTLGRLARGEDDRPVVAGRPAKSVGCERTFPRDIADRGRLREHLAAMAETVAGRLRKKGVRARTVTVKARLPDFTTLTRARTLRVATDSTRELQRAAEELFLAKLAPGGRAFRLLGVSASKLVRADPEQPTLFGRPEEAEERSLDRAVDQVRDAFGTGALVRGNQLRGK